MIRSTIALASVALVLGGCADGATDFGTPRPVALVTAGEQLAIPANASRASNLQLRRNIDAIAQGNLQAVRVHIVASGVAQARRMREALIGIGLDPTRITETISPAKHAASTTIILSRTMATPPDCATAITPAFPDDPGPSLLNLSHCIQDSNLAAMVVDPADLVAPPKLGPTDGAYLANGVQSWRENRRSHLSAQSSSAGSSSSDIGTPTSIGASGTPATMPLNSTLTMPPQGQ